MSSQNTIKVSLTDKTTKKHITMVLSDDGEMWERWESKDKKKWVKTHCNLSFDNIMKEKEDVKNKNYYNLFKMILNKK